MCVCVFVVSGEYLNVQAHITISLFFMRQEESLVVKTANY